MAGKLLFGASFKYFDQIDVSLMKLGIIAFALFLVAAWPALAVWVTSTSWMWFLVACIVFSIRPLMKAFKK